MKLIFTTMFLLFGSVGLGSDIAITMDNPNIYSSPLKSPKERDNLIRKTLKDLSLKIILFVSGNEVNSNEGKQLLQKWDFDGHTIGNHTYSHKSYNTSEMTFEKYSADILKNEPFIEHLRHFKKYFRFVMLKEGNTTEKRDRLRDFFIQKGYQNIPVTVDASDWYINARLQERLEENPKADVLPYRDYYLAHIWDRAQYYDNLASKVLGRKIKHTLLIHHNLLNALFLKDLVNMFHAKGWNVVSPEKVLSDPIFLKQTNVVPAGESVVWSLAKESGQFEDQLRYPGENDTYEKPLMDKLGL